MISNIAIIGLLCLEIGAIAFIYYTVIRYSKASKQNFDSLVKVVDSLNDANNINRLACEDKSSSLEKAIKLIEADIATLKEAHHNSKKEDEWLYWKLEKAEKALTENKAIRERLDSVEVRLNDFSKKKAVESASNANARINKSKQRKDKDGD